MPLKGKIAKQKRHSVYKKNKDIFKSQAQARRRAKSLGLSGIHSHGRGREKVFMPGSNHTSYMNALKKNGNN
tara:strand:+ start:3562 stop:3777 length:216 start_codon:yes stop_codon:yes gene_type:complete